MLHRRSRSKAVAWTLWLLTREQPGALRSACPAWCFYRVGRNLLSLFPSTAH
jgi:hypothetical protein